ncbi:hypothetical protein PoB_004523700 [Plakobranchus ocellatus]|uniref:Uncharacterized protein n=1 Tax=Plakobranchus ocellatus TaxID=259542 RepID=A0AAV4BHG8_9GAST|nr:hypothetical protein PoB_004523700 [Plakobranchus ocellatus]
MRLPRRRTRVLAQTGTRQERPVLAEQWDKLDLRVMGTGQKQQEQGRIRRKRRRKRQAVGPGCTNQNGDIT